MAITDKRVQKMNEILTSIKFIKMYAWVKAFAQDVSSRWSPRTRPHLLTRSQHHHHHHQPASCFLRDPRRGAQDPGDDGLLS